MTANILFALIDGLSGIILILLGFAIFRDNPAERLNRITSLMLLWGGIGAVSGAIHLLFIQLELFENFQELQSYVDLARSIWEFFFPQLLLFALVFPIDHPLILRRKWIPTVIFLPHVFHFLIILLAPQILQVLDTSLPSLIDSYFPRAIGRIFELIILLIRYSVILHKYLFSLVDLVYFILALVLLYKSWRHVTQPHLKQQVRFIFVGICIAAGLYTGVILLPVILRFQVPQMLQAGLLSIGLLAGSGSVAVAIIRYRFLDVSLLIRKSVFYSFSAGFVGGIYLFIIRYLNQITGNLFGDQIPILEIAFFIFALILFQPLMNRLETLMDTIFLRGGSDYRSSIQEFSDTLVTFLDFAELKDQLIEKLSKIMMVEQVILFLKKEDNHDYFPVAWQKKIRHLHAFDVADEFIDQLRQISAPILTKNFIRLMSHENTQGQLRRILHELDCYLIVPIKHHDKLIGFLTLDQKVTRTRYTYEDVTLLSVLSSQLAVALENIRLYQELAARERAKKEMEIAQRIQQNLLPQSNPNFPGVQISSISMPAIEVGGDYFDFFTLPGKKLGIVIGDVAGKGVFGAVYMAIVRSTLRANADQNNSPRETLLKVNHLLRQEAERHLFVSLFYGIFDLADKKLIYARAGHNPPFYFSRKNQCCRELTGKGIALGLSNEDVFARTLTEEHLAMNTGDFLLLYTDGITEAMNHEQEEFGEIRLFHLLEKCSDCSAQEIMDQIMNAVQGFVGNAAQHDDMTMVSFKILD